jgi:hypothetical protein
MENTPEELKRAGFSEEEIIQPITWQDYVGRLNHATFTKSFERISSIELSISKEEYEYLKRSLLGFGLKEKGKTFFNSQVKITYAINAHAVNRLKQWRSNFQNRFLKAH